MKKLLVALAIGLVCSTLPAVAQSREAGSGEPPGAHKMAKNHDFSDAAHWAELWNAESRDAWQKPLTVLALLGIQSGDRVVDLGAGTGYLTGYLAIQVGELGRVYAVDVEPAMLAYIEGREEFPHDRIETVLAAENDPRLPEGTIDLIVTVNTWHHIDGRGKYLRKLAKSLDPVGGRLAIIDFHAGELPVGPRPEDKLSRERVITELAGAGWRLEAESVALPYQYFLIFSPARKEIDRPFIRHRK